MTMLPVIFAIAIAAIWRQWGALAVLKVLGGLGLGYVGLFIGAATDSGVGFLGVPVVLVLAYVGVLVWHHKRRAVPPVSERERRRALGYE